jgi:hypothetical protein
MEETTESIRKVQLDKRKGGSPNFHPQPNDGVAWSPTSVDHCPIRVQIEKWRTPHRIGLRLRGWVSWCAIEDSHPTWPVLDSERKERRMRAGEESRGIMSSKRKKFLVTHLSSSQGCFTPTRVVVVQGSLHPSSLHATPTATTRSGERPVNNQVIH